MTTELILPEAMNGGSELIVGNADLIATRLPANINAQNFMTACVVEANALTKPCTPKSVAIATFNAAVLGLIPGSALGHAYFVPFKGVCTLMPGYRGFLDLAFGNNFLKDIHCDVVLEGEEFRYWKDETGPRILHEVTLDRDLQRENVLAAYCIYHTTSGGTGIKIVNKRELAKINTGKNVWKSDFISMALKTPVRRAAKEWKITPSLGRAIMLDEQAERGETQTCEQSFGRITSQSEDTFDRLGSVTKSVESQPDEPEPPWPDAKPTVAAIEADMKAALDLDGLKDVTNRAYASGLSRGDQERLSTLNDELEKSFA